MIKIFHCYPSEVDPRARLCLQCRLHLYQAEKGKYSLLVKISQGCDQIPSWGNISVGLSLGLVEPIFHLLIPTCLILRHKSAQEGVPKLLYKIKAMNAWHAMLVIHRKSR